MASKILKTYKEVLTANNLCIEIGENFTRNLKSLEDPNSTKDLNKDQLKKLIEEDKPEMESDVEMFKSIVKSLEPLVTDFNKKKEVLRVNNAMTEDNKEDGPLVRTEKGDYKFTRKGQIALNDELDKLLDKQVEVPVITINATGLTKTGSVKYEFLEGMVNWKTRKVTAEK